jgi:hypothetical protein
MDRLLENRYVSPPVFFHNENTGEGKTIMEELEKPITFDRGCDGHNHWSDILTYGKCHQCGLGYENN